MSKPLLGTESRPLRVAIVGSGPSGFYAAEALLQSSLEVRIDLLERLPVPYGLVRYGVAPDHPKLKEVSLVFARIASHPHCAMIGNVTIGKDVSLHELGEFYDAVIIASGAGSDRSLGIPGETLPGVHSATDFVGWYNGHPDCADIQFDLSQEVAVVIGQGNVALDVCRILSKSVDELCHTDIASHALEALANSRIREIHLVGRRGPVQAKFSPKELRELGQLGQCCPFVESRDLTLGTACLEELADPHADAAVKNLQLLESYARAVQDKPRRCHVRFLMTPLEILGEDRARQVVFGRTTLSGSAFSQHAECTKETVCIDAGLVLRSVGYRSIPFDELPFDAERGLIPHMGGRVTTEPTLRTGVYVTGWIKRGPSGIIGTNRADSVATVQTLLSDLALLPQQDKAGGEGLRVLLADRDCRTTDWNGWERIDATERARGISLGRPREKFVRIDEMLRAAV